MRLNFLERNRQRGAEYTAIAVLCMPVPYDIPALHLGSLQSQPQSLLAGNPERQAGAPGWDAEDDRVPSHASFRGDGGTHVILCLGKRSIPSKHPPAPGDGLWQSTEESHLVEQWKEGPELPRSHPCRL